MNLGIYPFPRAREYVPTRYTPPLTGAVARTVLSKLGDFVSVLDFGADPTGVADSSAAFQAAADLGTSVVIPAGTYLLSSTVEVTENGTAFRGVGRGDVTINCDASGPAFEVATGVSFIELHDFSLVRTGGAAVLGEDGIHFAGLAERVTISRLNITDFWNGLRLGTTSFSKVFECIVDNCFNHGIQITNASLAGGMQWSIIDTLCQRCDGWGLSVEAVTVSSSVGEIINFATFANKLGGARFVGSSGIGVSGIRWHGGFVGEDGGHLIYLDTFGSSSHRIQGVFAEIAGVAGCGRNQSTAAPNVGNGIHITINNTYVELIDCHTIGNSYSGIKTAAALTFISGCTNRLNGAAAAANEIYGVHNTAGVLTLVASNCIANGVGLRVANNALHTIVGNDLNHNTTAPIILDVTPTSAILANNGPATNVTMNTRRQPTTLGDANYSALPYDVVIRLTTALTSPRTITLPLANAVPDGFELTVVDDAGAVSGTNSLTIQRAGSDTINGGTSIVVDTPYRTTRLISDGASSWTTSQVGDYLSSNVPVGSAVALATNTQADITSLSLPAGEWDVSAAAQFTGAAATTVSSQEASLSLTSATLDYTVGRGHAMTGNAAPFNQVAASVPIGIAIQPVRFNLAAATTVYLVARSIFGTDTQSAFGVLRARRVK